MDIAPDFLEEITSSEKNEDILLRLRSDSLYSLSIIEEDDVTLFEDFKVRDGDDLGWPGYFIGQCTSLHTLHIKLGLTLSIPSEEINDLLQGINRSRSISRLELGCLPIGYESAGNVASIIRDLPLKRLELD